MKPYLKDYLVLFTVSGLIITLDQITKYYIRTHLTVGQVWSPWEWLTPYARFVHWYNTGAAFGMFQGKGWIFSIFAVIVAIGIIYYYPQVSSKDWILRLAMGMQFSGAIGNLIDRLTFGHVTDFISVGSFPVFNIADSSITVGTAIMLLGLWIQERKSRTADQKNHPDIDPNLDPNDQVNSEASN